MVMLKAAAQPMPFVCKCEVLVLRSARRNFFSSPAVSARIASVVMATRILLKRSDMLIRRVPMS